MRNIFYLCLTVLLFVSCNGQKLTFETISTKKKVLLFPDKKDTIPYATLDFKFVYPKTFDGNKEHLKALQQIFIEQFFDKDYVDYSPKETVKIYIDNYSKSYRKENAEFYDETRAYTCNHMLTIKDSIVFQNKSVLSVLQFFNSYTGGAHGVYSTSLKSINLKTLKELTLKEIIKQDKQHKFTNVLRNKLLKAMEERNGDKSYFSDFDKIQPNDNFFITDKGIKFIYNIYEIAPYIFGDFEVEILYEEISDLLKDDFKQRYNISSTEPKVAYREF